jgi:adenosylcobyric acid synthase
VGPEHAIPACDLIIIPGSKNVCADLQFLRKQGWDKSIAKHLRYGGKLMGVCGGFQMMGDAIADPHAIESAMGEIKGLGYLAMNTILKPEKILRHQKGFLWDKSTPVAGYEIHCGISQGAALNKPAFYFEHESVLVPDGAISDDNQILGTYLHGLFDSAEATQKILQWVGVELNSVIAMDEVREQELNRLASEVEAVLNMDWLGF